MSSQKFFFTASFLICMFLICCKQNRNHQTIDTAKSTRKAAIVTPLKQKINITLLDSDAEFEKKIYLHIDQIYTGKVYNENNTYAFYRVITIPEEENLMIIAEKIAVLDDEGGNLKLFKLSRVTDDGSALPKFGISSADSIKFIDSVTIQGYFNDKKKIIDLEKLKPYHPDLR
jgi:hypothetical protein